MRLILASQSPRRKDILDLMGLKYDVIPCNEPERAPLGCTATALVKALAYQKAEHVFREHPDCCVLGADTVVLLDGRILGKPHTPERAREYLHSLQGRSHVVYTGLTVLAPGHCEQAHCETTVRFRKLSSEEIERYIATGEPLDKAGAYGVQGSACVFVEGIEGNYFNIIGLPAPMVYEMLRRAGAILPSGEQNV